MLDEILGGNEEDEEAEGASGLVSVVSAKGKKDAYLGDSPVLRPADDAAAEAQPVRREERRDDARGREGGDRNSSQREPQRDRDRGWDRERDRDRGGGERERRESNWDGPPRADVGANVRQDGGSRTVDPPEQRG